MLSIRRTSLKASTSSLAAPAGSRQASSTSSSSKGRYLYPDGTPRRYVPVYPTGIHPALVNVQGLRSPSSRQARIPGAPRPRPTHPYPYNLNPNALNRPQLIETIRQALPRPTNPRPYDLFPTGRNPPTSPGYTPGAHTTSLNFLPSTRTNVATGTTFVHSSPPLKRQPNLERPREAPKELPYMDLIYGKKVPVVKVKGHHKSTEQWNADLAFSVRRGEFEESVKFVEEMRKNEVRCDEATLRLLVEGLDLEKVFGEVVEEKKEVVGSAVAVKEKSTSTSTSTWLPEATVLLEIQTNVSDPNSASNAWKSTLSTIADAERKIASHLMELALWEAEDVRLAQTIASAPPLSGRILATTKRLLAKAEVRSYNHAVNLFHGREANLQEEVRALEEDEDGLAGRSPEEVNELWEAHKAYNVSQWEKDVRAGWETERYVWVQVDQNIVQARRREMQGWIKAEQQMKSRKQEIDRSLADAREVVRLAEKLIVLPSDVNEDGTTSSSSSSTPLFPAGLPILRRLLRTRTSTSRFTPSSSSSTTTSSSDLSSLEDQKQAFLATTRTHLLQATHLVSHLESLERLTRVELSPSHWKTIIGKVSAYRVSTTSLSSSSSSSSSSLPTSETWKTAFHAARDLYLARTGSGPQLVHPRPARALSTTLLDTLLNTVMQEEKEFPLAIPTVTTIWQRLLAVDGGSALRASTTHHSSSSSSSTTTTTNNNNNKVRTKSDLLPLAPLSERNEPIYHLLRLSTAVLSLARKTDLSPDSVHLLDVHALEAIGAMMGEPGMFELDPMWEEGMKVETVVEGRKMRGLVERLRLEVGETVEMVWEGRGGREVVEEVVVGEGEGEKGEGEKTDEERKGEFVKKL